MGAIKMLLLTMLALGAPLAMAGLLLGDTVGTPGIDDALDELNSAVEDAAQIFDSDPPTVRRGCDVSRKSRGNAAITGEATVTADRRGRNTA